MSASHFVKKAAGISSLENWKGLHAGYISCYRSKRRHAQYRYGAKKGLRRARRRLGDKIIESERDDD